MLMLVFSLSITTTLSKKEKGFMDMDNSVRIAGEKGGYKGTKW